MVLLTALDMFQFNVIDDVYERPINTTKYYVFQWTALSLFIAGIIIGIVAAALRSRSIIPPCSCCCVCPQYDCCLTGMRFLFVQTDRRVVSYRDIIIRTVTVFISSCVIVFYIYSFLSAHIETMLVAGIIGTLSFGC